MPATVTTTSIPPNSSMGRFDDALAAFPTRNRLGGCYRVSARGNDPVDDPLRNRRGPTSTVKLGADVVNYYTRAVGG